MEFIILFKFRRKPSKTEVEKTNKVIAEAEDFGVKTSSVWWTLGRWDGVRIFEARNEKAMMKFLLAVPDVVTTETLLAVPRDEAVKLLG